MYKKILLAIDGSDHSKRAAENAITIAKFSLNSMLEIIYVIDPKRAKSEILNNWDPDDLGDKQKSYITEVEKMATKFGISYETTILYGEPGPTIVEYANKTKTDIVILGSRGLNGLQEFVIGSVSHKVLKRTNCPVLIVK
ncbi:MAG: universal stress protein [Bacillus sp. (in: Bacteria)]|nr:universal stress protein [Bacillus sp. (in: firmicutes)]